MRANHYDDHSDDDDSFFDVPLDSAVEQELGAYIASRGGIDKCMNCGRYKYSDELEYSPQVCKKPCHNPREY